VGTGDQGSFMYLRFRDGSNICVIIL
jgi:hypothetical protein